MATHTRLSSLQTKVTLTFCRLVGLSCVLSMIFIATCEETMKKDKKTIQQRKHIISTLEGNFVYLLQQ